ncbi:twitching motility protein PilJ [Spiribacter halobius]|uniref:Twitching motility protein PilJ n=2 Tax=Sediminicurvatus halobius TaxID=2182432 RepID=A0A2U2MYX2_9GAMM|nr:twitching motility protein PilJ [Spiribacter halobius]
MRRTANVLSLLVVVAILLMGGSFGYVAYYGNFEQAYAERADSIAARTQGLARNAGRALDGEAAGFRGVAADRDALSRQITALTEGEPETGLPPADELGGEAGQATAAVAASWAELRPAADTVVARQDAALAAAALADRFGEALPDMQELAAELAARLSAIGADRDQIVLAGELSTQAERIARALERMPGPASAAAAETLAEARAAFQRRLQALAQGGDLGVGAVTDNTAAGLLVELAERYEGLAGELSEVEAAGGEIAAMADAAESLRTGSDTLLQRAQTLTAAFAALPAQRPIKEWYGFVAGGIALVLLVLRGFLARSISQAELARTEAERERVNEAQRRNQEAILNLLDEIEGLKEGDLTVEASVGEEITGAIGDAFNDAIEALRNLVLTINETSVQVSSAAQQTQATAMHLAEASDHQAHQITAASAAVNEMAVSIDQVSRNAEESARVAQQSVELSVRGADTVKRTIEQMDSIREQIQETSKRIKRLGESSQEIGNIVELINDIADQTNILALNASIQAAMAGESGRGFAVVADEVQRLAERSGNATKQIEALVKTIQTDTNEAVISMEQSTSGVVAGARQAEEAGEALREIENVSKQLAGLIQNISEASRQQANAAANVSDTMNVIQEITSQTSAGTNETATSIGNLADLANDLRSSVAGFKLPEA